MKSGKTLVQNNVKDWGVKYNSEQITFLSIDVNWWGNRTIILGALDSNINGYSGIARRALGLVSDVQVFVTGL